MIPDVLGSHVSLNGRRSYPTNKLQKLANIGKIRPQSDGGAPSLSGLAAAGSLRCRSKQSRQTPGLRRGDFRVIILCVLARETKDEMSVKIEHFLFSFFSEHFKRDPDEKRGIRWHKPLVHHPKFHLGSRVSMESSDANDSRSMSLISNI